MAVILPGPVHSCTPVLRPHAVPPGGARPHIPGVKATPRLRPGQERDKAMTTTMMMTGRSGEGGRRSWTLAMERNATLRLPPRAGGQWLRVDRGQVMVTLEGDAEDHVLGPGEELVLTGRGLAVAWALEASRVAGGELHGARLLRAGPEAAAA
jgi:hypothetical protein